MDRNKLKEIVAYAIVAARHPDWAPELIKDEFEDWEKLKPALPPELRENLIAVAAFRDAEAALTAIEDAGYVLMPKDQILRKMSKDEFSELMAGVKFKEPSDG